MATKPKALGLSIYLIKNKDLKDQELLKADKADPPIELKHRFNELKQPQSALPQSWAEMLRIARSVRQGIAKRVVVRQDAIQFF